MSSSLPIGPATRIAGPYTASAGQTAFSFDFPLLDAGDLLVETAPADTPNVWTPAVLGTDYAVSAVLPSVVGGNVVFTAGRTAGTRVRITGNAVVANTTDAAAGGYYDANRFNRFFDRVTIWAQERKRETNALQALLSTSANGWTPLEAMASYGERRVRKIVDWIGGLGTKPAVNVYVGPAGYTADIAAATNIRGPAGAGLTVKDKLASTGDLPETGQEGDAYLIGQNLYIWSPGAGDWVNVGGFVATALATVNHVEPLALDIMDVSIPVTVNALRTSGYRLAGDGGGALYRRAASEPSHAGKLQSADGAWWEIAERKLTPQMFGVYGDGIHLDQDAMDDFLATAAEGYIPPGTYNLSSFNVRSNQSIRGAGRRTIIRCIAGSLGLIYGAAVSHATVERIKVQVPPGIYATTPAVHLDSCNGVSVEKIYVDGGGSYAVLLDACDDCTAEKITVENGYNESGIQVNSCTNCDIINCRVRAGSLGKYGIQLNGGSFNNAHKCRIFETPDNYFGIHSFDCSYATISRNRVLDTRREAIAFGGACVGVKVQHNLCLWTKNLGVGDFGISCAGYSIVAICGDFEISHNTIVNCALDGVGVAGFTQRGLVVDNIIRDCCYANASGFHAGVRLYGWEPGGMSEDIVVANNMVTKINSPGLLYLVFEVPGLGAVGRNSVAGNKGFGLADDAVYILPGSTSTRALNSDDLPALTFNSIITASSGTLTTANGTLRYQFTGKLVHCVLTVNIPTNGTGAAQLRASLPFDAVGVLMGRETLVTGVTVSGAVAGSQVIITTYNNAYPGANGTSFTLSGVLRLT
ncbi:right-handed parallel beta-helix repeat-containing protein [Ancylobacter sp. WKF20]|uniref:right-handed parallel beta-helix repeat-containing protein n=1 Tax=Ancylobacter sp. WKF20 TaxID=3039801 RepID=UPI0024343F36|nr:right-handed parallel beta-helix repeat-containing protein [Ancylobacter sp. WKF20]WGD31277.1 right-handed parallel beta-helix repeat-containing protein [Ancylobacter sp. WKF20]